PALPLPGWDLQHLDKLDDTFCAVQPFLGYAFSALCPIRPANFDCFFSSWSASAARALGSIPRRSPIDIMMRAASFLILNQGFTVRFPVEPGTSAGSVFSASVARLWSDHAVASTAMPPVS